VVREQVPRFSNHSWRADDTLKGCAGSGSLCWSRCSRAAPSKDNGTPTGVGGGAGVSSNSQPGGSTSAAARKRRFEHRRDPSGRGPPPPIHASKPARVHRRVDECQPSGMDPSDLAPAMNAFGPGAIVAVPVIRAICTSAAAHRASEIHRLRLHLETTQQGRSQCPARRDDRRRGDHARNRVGRRYNNILKVDRRGIDVHRDEADRLALLAQGRSPRRDAPHQRTSRSRRRLRSTDGGITWNNVSGAGFPREASPGTPDFIEMDSAAKTRTTWFAIAQNGASAIMTTRRWCALGDSQRFERPHHPHGNSQMFQSGNDLFVAGVGGPGQGVYRSPIAARLVAGRLGQGTRGNRLGQRDEVYAMYAVACSNCNLGTSFEVADLRGTTWVRETVPMALNLGPNSVRGDFDGTHHVFTCVMWSLGIWRTSTVIIRAVAAVIDVLLLGGGRTVGWQCRWDQRPTARVLPLVTQMRFRPSRCPSAYGVERVSTHHGGI